MRKNKENDSKRQKLTLSILKPKNHIQTKQKTLKMNVIIQKTT